MNESPHHYVILPFQMLEGAPGPVARCLILTLTKRPLEELLAAADQAAVLQEHEWFTVNFNVGQPIRILAELVDANDLKALRGFKLMHGALEHVTNHNKAHAYFTTNVPIPQLYWEEDESLGEHLTQFVFDNGMHLTFSGHNWQMVDDLPVEDLRKIQSFMNTTIKEDAPT